MALWHDQKASPKGRNLELLQQGARVLQEPPLGEDVRILNLQKQLRRATSIYSFFFFTLNCVKIILTE